MRRCENAGKTVPFSGYMTSKEDSQNSNKKMWGGAMCQEGKRFDFHTH